MNYPTNYLLTVLLCSLTLTTSLAQITPNEQERSIDTIKADTNKVKALYMLAIAQKATSLSQTKKYTQRALELARSANNERFLASALSRFGNFYGQLGEYTQAAQLLRESLDLSRATENYTQEAMSLNNLGTLYHKMGAPKKALDFFLEAQKITQKYNMVQLRNNFGGNIGVIYNTIGEKNKAINSYKASIKSAKENIHKVAYAYQNIWFLKSYCGLVPTFE